MKFVFTIFVFILTILNAKLYNTIKIGVSHRFDRNLFMKCSSESVCKECTKEDHYKKCDSICYCCNANNNQCISQS